MPKVPPEYAPLVSVVEPSSTGRATETRVSANAVFASLRAVNEAPPSICEPLKVIVPAGAVAPPTPTSPPADPEITLAAADVTVVLARIPYVELVPIVRGVVAANDGDSLMKKSVEVAAKKMENKVA